MSTPLVTVCVPSYNKARFIEATLESVRTQTFQDFELIVIDDASTDDSVAVIEAWRVRHGFPLKFVKHEANRGVCVTLNEALTMARGRYWSGLGADDVWHADMLERFVEAMERQPEDVAVVYGDAELIDDEGRLLPGRFIARHRRFEAPPEGRIFAALLEGNFIPAMATLCRVDCLRAVGGYDEELWYEDWDMWLRLAHRYAFGHLPGAFVQYRIVPDSMTNSSAWSLHGAPSTASIYLKWVGRDACTDRRLEERLSERGWEDALYAARHPAALNYAMRRWRRLRTPQALFMAACIWLGVPHAAYVGIRERVRRAKSLLRNAYLLLALHRLS